jgi:outer membrane protein
MNTIKPYLIPSGVIFSVLISLLGLFWNPSRQKVAYVRMEAIYNEFPMKLQLEGKLKETEKARQFLLDSMKLQLHQLTLSLQAMPKVDTAMLRLYNLKQQYLNNQQAQFDEDNQQLAQQYTTQIWGQLNQYTHDYGKEHGYDYILGASGDGTLMYASESEDVTDELKGYINSKYNGKTK